MYRDSIHLTLPPLAGKRSITTETALRLGKWFGTGPHIWLNLQHTYDLDLIQQDLQPTLDGIKTRAIKGDGRSKGTFLF